MKHIVISNIGNRNISLDNIYLIDYIGERDPQKRQYYINEKFPGILSKDFHVKGLSKYLLDHFKDYREQLSINILDKVLEKVNYQADAIYLVVSNQTKEKKQDQDTLYVGAIMKKLLRHNPRTQHSKVYLKTVTQNVTNTNLMLRFFKRFFKHLDAKYPKHRFVLSDAGGTGQQKTAMKLMAEFLFDSHRFRVYYPKINSADVEKVNQYEYRKLIVSEQVIKLCETGEYQAANDLLKPLRKDQLVKFLDFFKLRKSILLKDAVDLYLKSKDLQKTIKIDNELESEIYTKFIDSNLIQSLSNKHYYLKVLFNLCDKNKEKNKAILFKINSCFESLYLAEFYFSFSDYNNFVLQLSTFYEKITEIILVLSIDRNVNFGELINKNKLDFDTADEHRLKKTKLIFQDFEEKIINELCIDAKTVEKNKYNFPLWKEICVVYFVNKKYTLNLTNTIKYMVLLNSSTNGLYKKNYREKREQLGLNLLRNKLAHESIGVKKADLDDLFRFVFTFKNDDSMNYKMEKFIQQMFIDIKEEFNLQVCYNPYEKALAVVEKLLK